jgi:coenzyme PQQ synthesis protein D (PqqD)
MRFEPAEGAHPKGRDDGLVVERVDGELLIYDLERDRAHRLNEAAALVFEHCDGRRGVAELAALISAKSDQPVDEDVVGRALVRLGEAHLLEQPIAVAADGHEWSRRQVLRKVGAVGAAAGIGLPVVKSIVAPTPADAQVTGCVATDEVCSESSGCFPGLECCSANASCGLDTASGNCLCLEIQ